MALIRMATKFPPLFRLGLFLFVEQECGDAVDHSIEQSETLSKRNEWWNERIKRVCHLRDTYTGSEVGALEIFKINFECSAGRAPHGQLDDEGSEV